MRIQRSLQSRLSLRLALLMFLTLLVLALVLLYGFRSLGLQTSQGKAVLAAELVRNALASAKEQGLVDERDAFLAPLLTVNLVEGVRIVRGPAVDQQFGGAVPEKSPRDDVERAVLASGEMQTVSTETAQRALFRVVVPFKAIDTDAINCTACHEVEVGAVLGAVSVTMDLTEERSASLRVFLALAAATFVLCSGLLLAVLLFLRGSFTRPVQGVIETVAQCSDQFNDVSRQVAGGANSLASSTSSLAASTTETMSALTQMTASTRSNAGKASEAFQFANEAQRVMNDGAQAATRMVQAANDLRQTTGQSAEIIRSIDEIAFQTNLLALNAAVEAARAGDSGKGFAVVAEEVRSLAGRSADAARRISQLLELSQTHALTSVEVAERMAQVLTEAGQAVSRMRELMDEVTAESEQQSVGAGEAARAVGELDRVSQDTAANAEQSAATSEELASQAEELMRVVEILRTLVEGSGGSGSGNGNGRALPPARPAAGRALIHRRDLRD